MKRMRMVLLLVMCALSVMAQEREQLAEVLKKTCRVCGEVRTVTADLFIDLGSAEPGVEMSRSPEYGWMSRWRIRFSAFDRRENNLNRRF